MPSSVSRLWSLLGVLCSLLTVQYASAQVDSVHATGPAVGATLEDMVEVSWTVDTAPNNTSSFVITRSNRSLAIPDTVSIGAVASNVFLYEDYSPVPGVEYDYCVSVRDGGGTETLVACDIGARVIARPTDFQASDGQYEEWVALSWHDQSRIETGFNLYRDAGNAIAFDGVDDYVSVPGTTTLPASFTVEFWASRGPAGGNQFIINLENSPQGDPTSADLEIGFDNINKFVVGFGSNQLKTPLSYSDSNWHHWAVTYDAASRRRTIYADGLEVASDTYGQPFQSAGTLELGRQSTIGNKNKRGHFNGKVDELRLWSVELGPAEIPPLMTNLLRGTESGLVGLWPMDVASGGTVPDVVGILSGTILDDNGDASDWVASGVPDYYARIGANLTSYSDRATVSSFQSYQYRLDAFEDANGDGVYVAGTDYESEQRSDTGWRAALSPPGSVSATDGQFLDRVRITWLDRSDSETSYKIYRDGGLVGTVLTDSTRFDDFAATTTHLYCVTASNGVESIQVCDMGQAGSLPAPDSVAATNRIYDDRVLVSWIDTTDTEDGFEIFRDGSPIGTTSADAEEFSDLTAHQEDDYSYCVRAFSNADPGNPSYSSQACAPGIGARAAVLPPEAVTATDNEFEDRVELAWANSSTTVMLYKLYRNGGLIEVLDFHMKRAIDSGIPSDSVLQYCVVSETVVAPASASALQGQVRQILENIRYEDAIRAETGGTATSPETALATVYQSLGYDATGKNGASDIDGFVESAPICDDGSRLINAPTNVDATDNEFESHVQITWDDNSQIETGYYLYRGTPGGTPVPIDTLSPNRKTYGDYTGTPGVLYEYTLWAFDNFDRSTFGSASQDLGKRTLKPPTGLLASDATSETVVELDWVDNSDAEVGYNVYRRIFGASDSTLIGMTGQNEPAYTDTVPNALLGTEFKYNVTAFDNFGESLTSSDEGKTYLEAPANVNASDVYGDRSVVVWVDRSVVEDGYRLTRRQVGAGSGVFSLDVALPIDATMYTDNTGTPGLEYEYCVSATLQSNGLTINSDTLCDTGAKFLPGGGLPPTPGVQALKINSTFLNSTVDGAVDFGNSVAVNGLNALIGAPGSNGSGASSGLVKRSTFDTANMWTDVEDWGGAGSDGRADYGYAVDMSGPHAIVGDPFLTDSTRGAFTVWNRSGAGTWSRRFYNDETDAGGDNTGISVALVDSFAIVGNNLRDVSGKDSHGSVIICNVDAADRLTTECSRSDGVPLLENVLAANKRVKNAEFGYAVDITRVSDSLYALVGAPGNDLAYIFKCDLSATTCGATADWELLEELNTRFSPNKRFGAAVSINSKLAVVGAPGGEGMVVYERTNGDWTEQNIFSPSSAAGAFGSAIAVFDTTIIVGAPGETIAGLKNAGAVYVLEWNSSSNTLSDAVRYDARVAGNIVGMPGKVIEGAFFGTSVTMGSNFYLVGAPKDENDVANAVGAAYSIPIGLEPPDDLILPPDVDLAIPGGIRASDGTAPDRIQVRWTDESDDEDGHLVFRSDAAGQLEQLAEIAANVEFFDDFEAAPGEAYTYCVAAFFEETVTEKSCDIGWRPANGTIAGRLAARQGGGTDGAQVCLMPSPNRSLLFDGFGGYVEATVGPQLDLFNDITIEAWIRPNAVDGVRFIASKDSAYALAMNNGRLRFYLFGIDSLDATVMPVMTAGSWYHVAVSMDKNRNVTFYLDDAKENGRPTSSLGNTAGDTLAIGQRGNGTGFFKGEIDELRIWDIARTDSLIWNMSANALEGDEENLVGYWPLDQGLRFVAPDVTESAGHGRLIDGVYLTDEGGPLDICAPTTNEGNFSFARIRYGASTEFNVIPARPGRDFVPSFKKITLTTESPVQNEVAFTDVTAYPMVGMARYMDIVGSDTLTCPVSEVTIHVDKGDLATDDNVKTSSGADGSYVVAVDPSVDNRDTWFVIPTYTSPTNDEQVHTFSPANYERLVTQPIANLDFNDLRRHTLSGNFSGGDPDLCGQNIGVATIRIYTQDGCYDRTITVNSDSASIDGNGAFTLDLPPLQYLVEVDTIVGAPTARADEIREFFEKLGTLELDMRGGDVERNLIYRAPLTLTIAGLDPPLCPAGIVQNDEEDTAVRTLPAVPTIEAFEFVPLTFGVKEDYGNNQFCDVEEGTVTIFDAIADRVDSDSTMSLQDGEVNYVTYGASANVYSGARIQGVDRSFQKPITVVAQVEGREPLVETRWALVEGARERSSTFVSATTEEFPLLIVHDPPGSNSYGFLQKGTTYCRTFSNTKLIGGGGGVDIDVVLGFVFESGFSFGAHWALVAGGGVAIRSRTIAGQENGSLDGRNIEICMSTEEEFETSSDPGGVGEDVHIGVALNLIFAIADVLNYDQCQVDLSETLAADLDQAEPFKTSYVYSKTHIAASLIPELENLVKLAGGDAAISGDLGDDGGETTIRLQDAVDNWKKQLKNNEQLKEDSFASPVAPVVNRSFSGNTQFAYSESFDTTSVVDYQYTRVYVDSENDIGLFLDFGIDQRISVAFEVHSEWTSESDSTAASSKAVGYVLNDEDTGDYFSVDVTKDIRYDTFIFDTRSGRSSNPWESNTQKRDNPIIMVDPPVLYNVDPEDAGSFELTLINGSESNERRRYALTAPAETNRNNLTLTTAGGYLDGEPYLLDAGKAITVKLDVFASPSAFSYKNVGVVLYPEVELELWTGDARNPFVLADTAFFSVYFDSTGGGAMAAPMAEGWTWFSTNRDGGDVNTVLARLPATNGDIIRSQTAESRFDSTEGWTGTLTKLTPGEGYRVKLSESTVFRIEGEAVESAKPLKLDAGWNWIGYMPKKRLPLNFALASLKDRIRPGDIIVGQDKFAQYVSDIGWVGTLQEMAPGESYAIDLTIGGDLLYPTSDEGAVRPTVRASQRTTQGPTWEIEPERFDGAMTMVAEVRLSDVPLTQTTTKVAVFAGDSLRGVGEIDYIESLDRYLAFVLIYGLTDEEDLEELRVHVYDGENDMVYEDVGSLEYETQTMLGQPADPVVLELSAAGTAPQLMELPEEFKLYGNYPNPFNPTTTIAYDLPDAVHVNLTIFDVLGRRVVTLIDRDHRAGRHKVSFDAGKLASGFYLYRLDAGDFVEVRKMVLTK